MSKEHIFRGGIEGKICTGCGQWKPLTEYYRRSNSDAADGLTWRCRGCCVVARRGWRHRNPGRSAAGRRRLKRERVFRLRLLAGGRCHDCGEDRLWLLVFHHLDASEKLFDITINTVCTKSFEDLVAETGKCVLLCPNCHVGRHTTDEQMAQYGAAMEKIQEELS